LWLQRAVGSDFFRKAVSTYATQVAVVFIGLLTSAVVARILGPVGRGQYAVAMAVGLLGVQFGNLGLHVSNTFYVAKDRKLLPVLLANTMLLSFVGGGVGAALLGTLFFLAPKWAPVNGTLLVLALAWVPFGLAYLLTQNLLMGIQRVRTFNQVELSNKLGAFFLISALILWKHVTPATVLAATLSALAVSFGVSAYALSKHLPESPTPSLQVFRKNLSVGSRAYLVAVFGFLVLRIDLLMVKYLLGAEQAGYYSVAGTMADYILLLPAAVGAVLFPRLSTTGQTEQNCRHTVLAALGTAAVLLPIVLVAAPGARVAIRIVFGQRFLPAAGAFLLLLPGVFFLGVEVVLVQFLNSLGFPRSVVGAWFVTCLLNIGANLWAIPRFGIAGASVVSSISYTLMFLFVLLTVYRSRVAPVAATEAVLT
jgi:O-antigen/teichoic acid export membrane protein